MAVSVDDMTVPRATPCTSKSKQTTNNKLNKILVIEKNPTTTLDTVVLCKPINNPVIIQIINSPKEEQIRKSKYSLKYFVVSSDNSKILN